MNGWTFQPLWWNPGLKAKLDDQLNLFIAYGTDKRPPQAVATGYYHWENNYWRDEECHDFGQAEFDRAFEVAKNTMVDHLGHPQVDGAHAIGWLDNYRYRFSIWRAEKGGLVLQ